MAWDFFFLHFLALRHMKLSQIASGSAGLPISVFASLVRPQLTSRNRFKDLSRIEIVIGQNFREFSTPSHFQATMNKSYNGLSHSEDVGRLKDPRTVHVKLLEGYQGYVAAVSNSEYKQVVQILHERPEMPGPKREELVALPSSQVPLGGKILKLDERDDTFWKFPPVRGYDSLEIVVLSARNPANQGDWTPSRIAGPFTVSNPGENNPVQVTTVLTDDVDRNKNKDDCTVTIVQYKVPDTGCPY
ncbi:hypothetical protein CPB86DRAFT_817496 [Serendipita vermifera]|nr:hypothetical protein CPB86DRAFT_817496 [Serendipita vermifera]